MSKLRLFLLALIVASVPLSFAIRRAVEDRENLEPIRNGTAAPAFTLPRIGGGSVSSEDLAGKPYVLNFWGSWCGECENLLGVMGKNRDRFPDVTFLGVVLQDTPEEARRLADRTNADWPMLLDPEETVARSFGVQGAPVTFFVGKDGKVAGSMVGPFARPLLDDQIKRIS